MRGFNFGIYFSSELSVSRQGVPLGCGLWVVTSEVIHEQLIEYAFVETDVASTMAFELVQELVKYCVYQ